MADALKRSSKRDLRAAESEAKNLALVKYLIFLSRPIEAQLKVKICAVLRNLPLLVHDQHAAAKDHVMTRLASRALLLFSHCQTCTDA